MRFFGEPITRRQALGGLLSIAGSTLVGEGLVSRALAGEPSVYHPTVSAETYVWIQRLEKEKKTIADGLEEILAGSHEAGYKNVELSSEFFNPQIRSRTIALLKQYDLGMPTVFASSKLYEPAAAETSIRDIVEFAKSVKPLGVRAIVTNPQPKPQHQEKTDEELALQCRSLDEIGKELRKENLNFQIHHHTPELVNKAREWRYQLDHTDPKLALACVDVHWAYRGGQEPLQFIKACGMRLNSLHLRNSRNGVWMEDFSDGDVDYRPIVAYLRQIRYRGYLVVELAYEEGTSATRNLIMDLRLSRQYTERIFGV